MPTPSGICKTQVSCDFPVLTTSSGWRRFGVDLVSVPTADGSVLGERVEGATAVLM
jgi:hypothetical protein